MGWHWIISPVRYQAYYCVGTCDSLQQMGGSTSSKLKAETHRLTGDKKGKACCAPTVMAPKSLAFFTEIETVNVRLLPDMVILQCGCM